MAKIIDYFYTIEDDYIKAYTLIYQDDKLYKKLIRKYNYYIYGMYMIEKLKGRGYISIEEVEEKYDLTNIIEIEKEKSFLKRKKS